MHCALVRIYPYYGLQRVNTKLFYYFKVIIISSDCGEESSLFQLKTFTTRYPLVSVDNDNGGGVSSARFGFAQRANRVPRSYRGEG